MQGENREGTQLTHNWKLSKAMSKGFAHAPSTWLTGHTGWNWATPLVKADTFDAAVVSEFEALVTTE